MTCPWIYGMTTATYATPVRVSSVSQVVQLFKEMVRKLMDSLTKKAVNGSPGMFAAGAGNYITSQKIYGLVQCTGDITNDDCSSCLEEDQIFIDEHEYDGLRIYGRNCYFRYELSPFYNTTAVDGLPSPPPTETPAAPPATNDNTPKPSDTANSSNKSKLWVIITTASLASLICLSLLCFLWIKRRRRSDSREEKEELHDGQSILDVETNEPSILLRSENITSEFSLYNFSEIADATNHFSPENKLGEGGFGPVYKGQLPKGIEIAAKRLSAYSGQGLVEFKNEIQLIAKLQHRNLVSLIGCCIEGEEKILIYEYMSNKSLDFFLFDQTKGALLDWSKRFHIIEGIAQGLLYLHKHSRLRIIHRDLKVSNILLDNDMNPKISDFGMARIFGSNEIQANTNRVVGTYGYMSPEYASEGVFSIKSDVFSFGVLLLEIVSGKKNAGFHQYGSSLNLLGYTWELWKDGKWFEIVDTSLGDGYCRDEIMRCIHAALMCVQENPTDRPTMSNVVAMLSSENSSFPVPKQPAFFNLRTTTEAEEIVNQGETNSTINNITMTASYGR